MPRTSHLIVNAIFLFAATPCAAGQNPEFTLPLHYAASLFQPCDGYQPVDCRGIRPTVAATPGQPACIFLLLHNYNAVFVIQTAFEWGSWNLAYSLFECQLNGPGPPTSPCNPGGPIYGAITLGLDPLIGPELAVIGRLFFTPVSEGCIWQVQPAFPGGIFVLDPAQGIDQIGDSEPHRLGKVCVGPGGHDACDRPVAVDATTWGHIRSTFR